MGFLDKAIEIHGDKYDYSQVEYINAHKNVTIVCPLHGPFLQRPDAHIYQKQGCPKCGLKNRKLPQQKSNETFIQQAKEKWGNKYNYEKTQYVKKTQKIVFTCPIHGDVEQLPNLHLRSGCQYCNGRGISKHTVLSFVNIANQIHNGKYNYDKTKFNKINDDIIITCPIHGDFIQRANNHIHLKNGCPLCAKSLSTSLPEQEISNFIQQHYPGPVTQNDRTALDGKEIDIYLPELKLGIEYHGLYFHTETLRGKKHHYDKWKLATEHNIRLIQIYSNEYEQNQPLIESKILYLLGHSNKIHARKTKIVSVDTHDKNEFLTKHHLQGPDSSKICYGLTYNGELVSIMTFGPSRFNKKYKYELLRFCNKSGLSVVGGASKLLTHFRRNYPGSIISYADKRYSNGGLYHSLGFVLDGHTQPSFSYFNIKNNVLYNRMNFQKQYLKDMPGYDPDLTEYEIMQLNHYDRIWDCGQFRFGL